MSNKFSDFLDSCIFAEKLLKESSQENDSIEKFNATYVITNQFLDEKRVEIIRYRFKYYPDKNTILHFFIEKGIGDSSKTLMSACKKYLNRKFKGQLNIELSSNVVGYYLNIRGNLNCMKELVSERVQLIEEFLSKEPRK